MKKFIASIFLSIVVLGISLQSACSKDEENEIEKIVEVDRPFISFDPPSALWYFRTAPDSILIKMKNGLPPYTITQNSSHINARIDHNWLILYPRKGPWHTEPIFDFINIRDQSGNINAFNFMVESLMNRYDVANSTYNLKLSGNFNVNYDTPIPIPSEIRWDEFESHLLFDVEFDLGPRSGELYFVLPKVNSTGAYIDSNSLFVARYKDSTGVSRYLIAPNSDQKLTFEKLGKNRIECSLDIDLEESYQGVNYQYNLKGNVVIVK